jgi:ribosomal protein L29
MPKLKEQRNEIRDMTIEAAQEELARLRRNLFDLRMQVGRGEVKDVRQFAQTRKQIARIMHKLHMFNLYGEQEPEFIEEPEEEVAELPAPTAKRQAVKAAAEPEPAAQEEEETEETEDESEDAETETEDDSGEDEEEETAES